MFALAAAMELRIYGITGLKSALFVVALVVPLYVLLAVRRRRLFGLSAAVAPTALILGSFVVDQLTTSGLATSLFVRRTLVLAGQLVADYYDFFSRNPTYALSRSIFKSFGPGPYDIDPPNLIGSVYFGNSSVDANASIWADAFANFGIAGILVFTMVLCLVLFVLDSVAFERDLRITGAIAGLLGLVLSNSALFTTILTHGIWLAIVLILLMPRQGRDKVITPSKVSLHEPRVAGLWREARE
jgi:hypothetical protein